MFDYIQICEFYSVQKSRAYPKLKWYWLNFLISLCMNGDCQTSRGTAKGHNFSKTWAFRRHFLIRSNFHSGETNFSSDKNVNHFCSSEVKCSCAIAVPMRGKYHSPINRNLQIFDSLLRKIVVTFLSSVRILMKLRQLSAYLFFFFSPKIQQCIGKTKN